MEYFFPIFIACIFSFSLVFPIIFYMLNELSEGNKGSKKTKMKSNIKKIEFIYETSWIKKEMVALYNSNDKSENYVKNQLKLYPDLGFDSCHILVIPKVTFENVFRGMI